MNHKHECGSAYCSEHNGMREHAAVLGHKHKSSDAGGRCCGSAECSSNISGVGTRLNRSACEPSNYSLMQDFARLTIRKSGADLCGNGHCHCEDQDSSRSILPPREQQLCEEFIKSAPDFEPIALGVADEYGILYEVYRSEEQMADIMRLISKDLSEPYSIYTYRYFIHNWPHLCFLAVHENQYVGAIVCKLDLHKRLVNRGYIAMLAVDEKYRRKKIGSKLVRVAVDAMIAHECEEVVLETEVTNKAALRLYENLGFVRDKRLLKYYLNGVDAFRLKLWLR